MNQPPDNPYGGPPQHGGDGQPPGGMGQPPGGYGQPPGFIAAGPPGVGAPGGPPPGDAAAKVQLPAILMMVFSGIAILLSIVGILLNVLGAGIGAISGGDEAMGQVFSSGVGVASAVISLIFNAVVIFGALKMKNLQAYTFALILAVLFALPCSLCCLINTPIGIWALVTLLDKDLKAAFTS